MTTPIEPTEIGAWPTPTPQRTQLPTVFRPAADAWLGVFPEKSELFDGAADDTYQNAIIAFESANNAVTSADIAVAAANFKGKWVDLTGALEVPASVAHEGTVWLLLNNITDVTASEPAADNDDWGTLSQFFVVDRSTAVTLIGQDIGKLFVMTGTFTQPVAPLSEVAEGWYITIQNAGSGTITFDPDGADTINGKTSLSIAPGNLYTIVRDESEFRAIRTNGAKYTEFTESGTFEKDPQSSTIIYEIVNGGQSGALSVTESTSASNSANGGDGGFASRGTLPASAFPASATVTVGAGGSARAATSTAQSLSGIQGGISEIVGVVSNFANASMGSGALYQYGTGGSNSSAIGGAGGGDSGSSQLMDAGASTFGSKGNSINAGDGGRGARGKSLDVSAEDGEPPGGGGGGVAVSGMDVLYTVVSGAGADGVVRIWEF